MKPQIGSPEWKKGALAFDPFLGDMDGPSDRTLSDRIIRCAKSGKTCLQCSGGIQAGTLYRKLVSVFDGMFSVATWCQECCEAMVQAETGDYSDDEVCVWESRRNLCQTDTATCFDGGE